VNVTGGVSKMLGWQGFFLLFLKEVLNKAAFIFYFNIFQAENCFRL